MVFKNLDLDMLLGAHKKKCQADEEKDLFFHRRSMWMSECLDANMNSDTPV